jgi:hypothetical protein
LQYSHVAPNPKITARRSAFGQLGGAGGSFEASGSGTPTMR